MNFKELTFKTHPMHANEPMLRYRRTNGILAICMRKDLWEARGGNRRMAVKINDHALVLYPDDDEGYALTLTSRSLFFAHLRIEVGDEFLDLLPETQHTQLHLTPMLPADSKPIPYGIYISLAELHLEWQIAEQEHAQRIRKWQANALTAMAVARHQKKPRDEFIPAEMRKPGRPKNVVVANG